MGKKPTRHLALRRHGPVKVACGQADPKMWTRHPGEVTCRACRHTLVMAEVEKEFYTKRGKGTW